MQSRLWSKIKVCLALAYTQTLMCLTLGAEKDTCAGKASSNQVPSGVYTGTLAYEDLGKLNSLFRVGAIGHCLADQFLKI